MDTAHVHSGVDDRVDGRVRAVFMAVYTDRVQGGITAVYTPVYTARMRPSTRLVHCRLQVLLLGDRL